MVILNNGRHEPGAPLCVPDQHCYSCNVDESGSAYQWCFECGHGYRTRRELRKEYKKIHNQLLVNDWKSATWRRDSVSLHLKEPKWRLVYIWIRSRFVRVSRITFCQKCIHNF